MKQIKTTYFVGILFLIGIISRCYLLGYLPAGVNWDEAMGAMDAYALSMYGTDRFGTELPVHFRAWGYTQMSVFLAYLQAVCIRILGFNTMSIRIPIFLLSVLGMVAIYWLCRKFMSERISILVLFLVIISPWHLIQSRWALDCNAMPHVFLIGFTLLLYGLESKHHRSIAVYSSMLFFGLTFYCYGIAVYSVPFFLVFFALYLIVTKRIQIKELLICIIIFLAVAWWEIVVMFINYMDLETIHTPLFTIERFENSIRSNDILFMNFSWEQLWDNCKNLLKVLFVQPPEAGWNNVAKYGTIYPVSGIFGILGVLGILFALLKKRRSIFEVAVLLYLFTGVWIGISTKEVNVNRLNLIFYPWLILVARGIDSVRIICVSILQKIPAKKLHIGNRINKISFCFWGIVVLGYVVLGAAFFRLYFLKYEMKYGDSCFNYQYLQAMKYVDDLEEYDSLFITAYTGHGAEKAASEILMNYAARHDPLYIQGKSNVSNQKEYLPYKERYHFFYSWEENEAGLVQAEYDKGYRTCLLVHMNELENIDMPYVIIKEIDNFRIIEGNERFH